MMIDTINEKCLASQEWVELEAENVNVNHWHWNLGFLTVLLYFYELSSDGWWVEHWAGEICSQSSWVVNTSIHRYTPFYLPSQAYDQQKVKSCILSLEEDVEEIWTYFAKPAYTCLALPKNYYATDASLQCAQYWTCWFS